MRVPKHRVAVVVIVRNKARQVLLVKDWRRGWEFPGGLVEEGETVERAAIREVEEETGIVPELTKFRFVSHDVARNTFVFLFLGKAIKGKLRASDETSEVGYFSIDDALLKMTPKNYNGQIKRCLDTDATPFFMEYHK